MQGWPVGESCPCCCPCPCPCPSLSCICELSLLGPLQKSPNPVPLRKETCLLSLLQGEESRERVQGHASFRMELFSKTPVWFLPDASTDAGAPRPVMFTGGADTACPPPGRPTESCYRHFFAGMSRIPLTTASQPRSLYPRTKTSGLGFQSKEQQF